MAPYSSLELAYARPIANAMLDRPEFLQWLLSGTKFQCDALTAKPLGQAQAGLRSSGLKNPYWFNYWCQERLNWYSSLGLRKEKLRIFFAYIPARFGIINPDDEDPPELASID